MAAPCRVLFTDLDGTCIHYDWHQFATVAAEPDPASGLYAATSLDGRQHAQLLRLPPSTSGAQGVISLATLRLYAALRDMGVRLVVVTGARTATLLARLPYIPAADAYVAEGGGRIFYPAAGAGLPTAAPLVEDLGWRQRHATTAGPPGQEGVAPEARAGSLWALYAQLQAGGPPGLHADALSYSTAFRLKGAPAAVKEALRELPEGLATALNLGAADIFPTTSGKENAARYLMQRLGAQPPECAFMCDDDNDLGLAALVGRAYLPSITADSVRQAVAAAPHRFYVATAKGVFGAEECLRLLVARQIGVKVAPASGAGGGAAAPSDDAAGGPAGSNAPANAS